MVYILIGFLDDQADVFDLADKPIDRIQTPATPTAIRP